MKTNRTKNATRNAVWGLIEKLITIVLPFAARTVLLYLLGENYLGLNGLFSSVLQVLNMADFGFGAAITYCMYKPLAEDDTETVNALLGMYRNVFRVIGIVMMVVGIGLMPFLPQLVNDDVPENSNIYILFAIYLANTVLSYLLFAYKKSLLQALQRNDLVIKVSVSLLILQYGLQISLLFILHDYYVYLLVLPLITLLSNIITSAIVDRSYPQYRAEGTVSRDIKASINRQIKGLFVGKLCTTTRNSLDNIFISSFIGLTQVAVYGNYFFVLNAIHELLGVCTNAALGGIGNSIAKDSKEKNLNDFNNFSFLYAWMAGWFSCCLVCLYQHFMMIWMDNNQRLMFSKEIMILCVVYFYILSIGDVKNIYSTARGLWWENRNRSICEMIGNVLLNYLLCKLFGVAGIILATIITMLFINFTIGSRILFKEYFSNGSLLEFFKAHGVYAMVTLFVCFITYSVCSLLPGTGFPALILKGTICLLLPNILYYLAFFKTKRFNQAKSILINVSKQISVLKNILK